VPSEGAIEDGLEEVRGAAPAAPATDGETGPEGKKAVPERPSARGKRKHSLKSWLARPTNRAMLAQLAAYELGRADLDAAMNERLRLPAEEEVHLGGILMAEAFTPSTIRRLKEAIRALPPGVTDEKRTELLARLEVFRRPSFGTGSSAIGYAIPRTTGLGPSFYDQAVPKGVDAIWLRMYAVMPALTVVVATFTFDEASGNLTPLLRADYSTGRHNIRLKVPGRAGKLRAWYPFGRPRLRGHSESLSTADGERRRACEDFIRSRQKDCADWLAMRFPGCFSEVDDVMKRPAVRMFLTRDEAPFSDEQSWREVIGLWPSFDRWDSTEQAGWSFRIDELQPGPAALVIAGARRTDAAHPPGGDDPGTSSWFLTQRFHDHQGELFARWASACLVDSYTDRLAGLRDEIAKRGRRRPVREAEVLDSYLMTNGLDSDAVVSDVLHATEDLGRFAWGFPKYVQHDAAADGDSGADEDARLFARGLGKWMRSQATRLQTDSKVAVPSVIASAGLRQAVMNTKLQRVAVGVALVAAVIAVVSLTRNPSDSGGGATNSVGVAARCSAQQLRFSYYGSSAAAGTAVTGLEVTNTSNSTCTLEGYPVIGFEGTDSVPLKIDVLHHGPGVAFNQVRTSVRLSPGARAGIIVTSADFGSNGASTCPRIGALGISLTQDAAASHVALPAPVNVCGVGLMVNVSAFFAANQLRSYVNPGP